MLKYFFVFFLIGTLFVQCRKDDAALPVKSDLKVNFVATYDNKPFVFNRVEGYEFGSFIQFSKLDFFISDLQLVAADSNQLLKEIGFLDFSTISGDPLTAANGLTWTCKDIPFKNFTGIKVGIGVKPSINKTTPADYSSSDPLSNLELYWAGWKSYIFSRLEGKMDTVSDGRFATGISYHSGLDENYREITLPANIDWNQSNASKTLVINIDVKYLFKDGDSWLNIREITEAHGPSDKVTIKKMVDNYNNAFSVKF